MTWLVALSAPLKQAQVLCSLADLDFQTYCPQYQERIVRAGRCIYAMRSLFGRYFFVYLSSSWKSIHDVKHVSQILMGPNEQPLPVRDSVIEEIKRREEDETAVGFFLKGQKVTPNSGHLAGAEGRFERFVRNREVALFDILGVKTPVEFSAGTLVALEEQSKKSSKRRMRNRYEASPSALS